jgi:hypothetical protein
MHREALAKIVVVALTGSLVSCGPAVDGSTPWWVQVVPGADTVLDAAFNQDATEASVFFLSAGQPHLGRIKVDSSPRRIDDLGVVTFTPPLPNVFSFTTDTVDLSVRPGTAETWAFVSGFVYRFQSGSAAGTRVSDAANLATFSTDGSLGFVDQNTLIWANDVGLYLFEIAGDSLGAGKQLSSMQVDGVRQVVGVDGQIWESTALFGGRAFKRDGSALARDAANPQGQFFSQPLLASNGGAIFINSSNAVGICVVSRDPNGGAIPPTAGPIDAQGCDNLDIPFDTQTLIWKRGELSQSGRKMLLTGGFGLVLASEDEPRNVNQDLEGTWCSSGIGGSFTVAKGEVTLLRAAAGKIDDQFKKVVLTGSGAIRNLSLQEPSDVIKENVVRSNFDYFFKRSGHSLVVFGPVTKEQRARSQPYFNRTGLYFKGADANCQALAQE